jgi:hypothetical protein
MDFNLRMELILLCSSFLKFLSLFNLNRTSKFSWFLKWASSPFPSIAARLEGVKDWSDL